MQFRFIALGICESCNCLEHDARFIYFINKDKFNVLKQSITRIWVKFPMEYIKYSKFKFEFEFKFFLSIPWTAELGSILT